MMYHSSDIVMIHYCFILDNIATFLLCYL